MIHGRCKAWSNICERSRVRKKAPIKGNHVQVQFMIIGGLGLVMMMMIR